MVNITIRNIPKTIMNKIRLLSKVNRRSINNEILFIIEKGLESELRKSDIPNAVTKTTQMEIWRKLSGKWMDDRHTENIIKDIYNSRSKGSTLMYPL